MAFQCVGAYLGVLMAFYWFSQGKFATLTYVPPYYIIQGMVSEMFGAFLLVSAYLTQNAEKYRLSQDEAITAMIISASYFVGMQLSHASGGSWSQSPLNPAIALAEISFITMQGHIDTLHWSWIYLTFGWLGSLLAVLAYECGFKRMSDKIEEIDEHNEEAANSADKNDEAMNNMFSGKKKEEETPAEEVNLLED